MLAQSLFMSPSIEGWLSGNQEHPLVLVPRKGAHGTTTAVIQISILSSNSIKKGAFETEMLHITNSSNSA